MSARLEEGRSESGVPSRKTALLLYYQPILDLVENEIRQYELLLRLPSEQGGAPLAPSTSLYVAERCGLIQPIDCWVVGRAIAMIAEHRRAGTIAEFVSDEDSAGLLRQIGVDYAQGYHVGPPGPRLDFPTVRHRTSLKLGERRGRLTRLERGLDSR